MLLRSRPWRAMSLRDAVHCARESGILSTAHRCPPLQVQPQASHAPAASAAKAGGTGNPSPELFATPSPDGAAAAEAHWARIEARQRHLVAARRRPSTTTVWATPQSCNLAHVEGVVSEVECGYLLHHREGPSHAVRQVVTMVEPAEAGAPHLQLWLDVPEDGRAIPLAVRCALSEDAVRAAWVDAHVAGDHPSPLQLHNMLEAYHRAVRKTLQNKRIIVSGTLKEELMYDADVKDVVKVPVLRLPRDGLGASYHILE